jgi:hypothetical protein
MIKVNDSRTASECSTTVNDIPPGTVFQGRVYSESHGDYEDGIWLRLDIGEFYGPDEPLCVRLFPAHPNKPLDLLTYKGCRQVLNYVVRDATLHLK